MDKKSLNDYILKKHTIDNAMELIDPVTNQVVGKFPWDQAKAYDYMDHGAESFPLDNLIKMKSPELNPDLQRKGLGEQVYSQIEKITGKTIIPDVDLTENAANLHEKKGLGKSFGSSNYKPKIIDSIINKLGDSSANRLRAEKIYNVMKGEIVDSGVKGFKSIAPLLGKGLAAGAGGALSLAAEASDSPEVGDRLGQDALERDITANKQQNQIEKANAPKEAKIKALELFKKNRIPY